MFSTISEILKFVHFSQHDDVTVSLSRLLRFGSSEYLVLILWFRNT